MAIPIVTGNVSVDTIIQYVLDDTGRGDLMEVIKRRIQRSVLRFHRKDFWKKDVIEQTYIFDASGNIQVLNLDFLTRFRQFWYVRKFRTVDSVGDALQDATTGQIGTAASGDITERSADRMFDGYGGDLDNVMYRSGNFLKLRVSESIDRVFIGYFSDPIIEPLENMTSWIADNYKNLITCDVKWRIFHDIGKDAEKQLALGELNDEILSLQTNNTRIAMA